MPTYEYRCPEGHEFELLQKMTGRVRAKCPTCGRLAARQISGGAGFIFKGSGFYITDYGKDGKGPRTNTEGESKPESTPAKKDEAAAKPAAGGPTPKSEKPPSRKSEK